ncbi:MAG: hypothetical protein A3F16_04785 [Deltaproteobacteria bacterium RIFCSPHIGHO2_12_FULL_43_9]|nr:MAG: hypothetical protein A3F16_04785 [Deltaproteobacteria bacterium RIFCSPHIGHO2_12_FULL_43_9]
MKLFSIFLVFFSIMLGALGSSFCEARSPKTKVAQPTLCRSGNFKVQFLCYINEHRKQNGKTALSYDSSLTSVAFKHSAWMQGNGTMSHIGENRTRFYERCQQSGTMCYAENIAKGFTSAKHLFILWKESAGHNINMLGHYTEIGLGIAGAYATLILR